MNLYIRDKKNEPKRVCVFRVCTTYVIRERHPNCPIAAKTAPESMYLLLEGGGRGKGEVLSVCIQISFVVQCQLPTAVFMQCTLLEQNYWRVSLSAIF